MLALQFRLLRNSREPQREMKETGDICMNIPRFLLLSGCWSVYHNLGADQS